MRCERQGIGPVLQLLGVRFSLPNPLIVKRRTLSKLLALSPGEL